MNIKLVKVKLKKKFLPYFNYIYLKKSLNLGIMPHTDSPEIFGPVILSLSMLSPCLMTFTHKQDSSNRSIILLSK
jgi:hypothetical protein